MMVYNYIYIWYSMYNVCKNNLLISSPLKSTPNFDKRSWARNGCGKTWVPQIVWSAGVFFSRSRPRRKSWRFWMKGRNKSGKIVFLFFVFVVLPLCNDKIQLDGANWTWSHCCKRICMNISIVFSTEAAESVRGKKSKTARYVLRRSFYII